MSNYPKQFHCSFISMDKLVSTLMETPEFKKEKDLPPKVNKFIDSGGGRVIALTAVVNDYTTRKFDSLSEFVIPVIPDRVQDSKGEYVDPELGASRAVQESAPIKIGGKKLAEIVHAENDVITRTVYYRGDADVLRAMAAENIVPIARLPKLTQMLFSGETPKHRDPIVERIREERDNRGMGYAK